MGGEIEGEREYFMRERVLHTITIPATSFSCSRALTGPNIMASASFEDKNKKEEKEKKREREREKERDRDKETKKTEREGYILPQ